MHEQLTQPSSLPWNEIGSQQTQPTEKMANACHFMDYVHTHSNAIIHIHAILFYRLCLMLNTCSPLCQKFLCYIIHTLPTFPYTTYPTSTWMALGMFWSNKSEESLPQLWSWDWMYFHSCPGGSPHSCNSIRIRIPAKLRFVLPFRLITPTVHDLSLLQFIWNAEKS